MGDSKPAQNREGLLKRRKMRAARSLRKRGYIWWTHFGCRGQFFRRSLGTSDRSKALRAAEKLIALAEAGKIQAKASSIDERKAQKGASLKKSDADPKLNRALCRRNQKSWDERDSESLRRHSDAIKAAANRPGARKVRSEKTTGLWQVDDYRNGITAAVTKTWKSRKLRKEQSKRIKKARAKPEVKAHHLAGRIRAAKKLLQQQAAASDGGTAPRPGRPSMDERFRHAAALKESGWKWRAITIELDGDYAKLPDAKSRRAAVHKMRVGTMRWIRRQKQETPTHEPETLLDG